MPDRRRCARLLTLVLFLELAVLCCACTHIACHHCTHGPDCSICEYVKLGLRTALLLPAAILSLVARLTCLRIGAARRVPAHAATLFDRKVQLND